MSEIHLARRVYDTWTLMYDYVTSRAEINNDPEAKRILRTIANRSGEVEDDELAQSDQRRMSTD